MREIQNLIQNAWNWDLREFASRTGLDATTEYAQKKFIEFQKAADTLHQFDDRLLQVITQS